MLDFITETNSVWQNMRSCGLPLVLYGMGNGADAVLDRMAAEGLTAAGIFVSDELLPNCRKLLTVLKHLPQSIQYLRRICRFMPAVKK